MVFQLLFQVHAGCSFVSQSVLSLPIAFGGSLEPLPDFELRFQLSEGRFWGAFWGPGMDDHFRDVTLRFNTLRYGTLRYVTIRCITIVCSALPFVFTIKKKKQREQDRKRDERQQKKKPSRVVDRSFLVLPLT